MPDHEPLTEKERGFYADPVWVPTRQPLEARLWDAYQALEDLQKGTVIERDMARDRAQSLDDALGRSDELIARLRDANLALGAKLHTAHAVICTLCEDADITADEAHDQALRAEGAVDAMMRCAAWLERRRAVDLAQEVRGMAKEESNV